MTLTLRYAALDVAVGDPSHGHFEHTTKQA